MLILGHQTKYIYGILVFLAVDEGIRTAAWVDGKCIDAITCVHQVVTHIIDFLAIVVVVATIVVGKSVWYLIEFYLDFVQLLFLSLLCREAECSAS